MLVALALERQTKECQTIESKALMLVIQPTILSEQGGAIERKLQGTSMYIVHGAVSFHEGMFAV